MFIGDDHPMRHSQETLPAEVGDHWAILTILSTGN
jgi:hypothetical protein